MDTVTFNRKGIEINHMVASAIHKNTDFVIGMPVRLLSFVRIFSILNGLTFHLANMKGNFFITPGKFIYVDIFEHITKYSKKDALLTKYLQAEQFSVEKF
jgi:hypothetical protein